MTQAGYDKLLAEIKEMETVQRPALSQQIAEARDKGDLSENAEYDAAKEAQGMLEAKIAQLKGTLSNVRIVDESKIKTDAVQMLTKVRLTKFEKDGTENEVIYTLVSKSEADRKKGKISVETPIAKGLLGKKVGETAEIVVPVGTLRFRVEEISLSEDL